MIDRAEILCQRKGCSSRPTAETIAAAYRDNGFRRQRPSLYCDQHAVNSHGTPIEGIRIKSAVDSSTSTTATTNKDTAVAAPSPHTGESAPPSEKVGKTRAPRKNAKGNEDDPTCGGGGFPASPAELPDPPIRRRTSTVKTKAKPLRPPLVAQARSSTPVSAAAAHARAMESRTGAVGDMSAPYFVSQERDLPHHPITTMPEDSMDHEAAAAAAAATWGGGVSYAPRSLGAVLGGGSSGGGRGYVDYRGGYSGAVYEGRGTAYGGGDTYGGSAPYDGSGGHGYGERGAYVGGGGRGHFGDVGGGGGYGRGVLGIRMGRSYRGVAANEGGREHMDVAFGPTPTDRSHSMPPDRGINGESSPMLELPDISMGVRSETAGDVAAANEAASRRAYVSSMRRV